MAKDKKGFILYADLIHTVDKMPSEKAGDLFKHILKYVNDLNPITTDLIIELTFEPIKQQLKRDLNKWEDKSQKRSNIGREGGLKSGEARRSKLKQNEPIGSKLKQNEQVTVNVNDILTKVNNIGLTTLLDCEKLFLEKTAFNWTEQYAKKEAEKFYNFYSAKGWVIGKNKMKSLTHAISGWMSRQDKPETINAQPKKITQQELNEQKAREFMSRL